MSLRTHKASGWTREAIGFGNYRITPADGSGVREVAFMSAGSWANLPNDRREHADRDRVVLVSGEPLPAWALEWLEKANAKQCEHGRAAFRAALEDDEDAFFGRNTGW
jgi:hypothetical protein